MKVAFDIDGVVLRSIEVILDLINKHENRNLTPEDLSSWDLEPLGLRPSTLRDAVDHMYAQPHIEPYDGAVKALSRIYRTSQEPLLFITGRADPSTAHRQLEALPWNPTAPEMIVIGGNRDKRSYLAERNVDFIIEDDPKHLTDYLFLGMGVGLMLRPWNRHLPIPVTERFQSWDHIETWFQTLMLHGTAL